MPWFRIDDGFTNSKPVLKLQRRVRSSAIGLWTLAGAWSAKELTDGNIPEYLLEEFASTPAIAAHLVACGLWEKVENGWSFVGWSKYQPTREQVMADRERETERKRVYRESHKRPTGTKAGQSAGHQEESEHPDPTRPVPKKKERGGFDEFWSEYPRKIDKGHARTAYERAAKKASPAAILKAALAFKDSQKDAEPRFVAYPATWLNGERWTDEAAGQVSTPDAVTEWLRDMHRAGTSKPVVDRSGLGYYAPDNRCDTPEEYREVVREDIRRWITEHHDEIVRRIVARESQAA